MSLIIGLLTFIMVLNCFFLILLVLIQLPKKEAGMGLAFGGAATDALFGAGSGTVLTKITKYGAGFFFGLSVILAMLNNVQAHRTASASFLKQLTQPPRRTAPAATPTAATAPAPSNALPVPAAAPTLTTSNALMATNLLMSAPAVGATNVPAPPPNLPEAAPPPAVPATAPAPLKPAPAATNPAPANPAPAAPK